MKEIQIVEYQKPQWKQIEIGLTLSQRFLSTHDWRTNFDELKVMKPCQIPQILVPTKTSVLSDSHTRSYIQKLNKEGKL